MTKAQRCCVRKVYTDGRTKFDFKQNDKTKQRGRQQQRKKNITHGMKMVVISISPCALPFRSFSLMTPFSIIKR